MGAHALLSASGSSRWMRCPPSARLEEQIADSTSVHAQEGTFAHTLAELHLAFYLNQITKAEFYDQVKVMQEDPFYSISLYEYVQVYVDFATEKINEARAHTKDAEVLLEMKLDYSPWVPEGFGTGDLVLVTDEVLEIIDLKFGMGIAVSAVENSQMRLYALGAIHQFEHLYDIQTVRMTICQPRLDSISTDELSVDELLEWAEKEVKPAAELAWNSEGAFKAGEHCRFCRVKATCRARAEEYLKHACHDFKPPPLLSDDEIADILATVDELKKWVTDVQAFAYSQAVNESKEWPGFKLVEGRSSRKYGDEAAIVEALLKAGFDEDKIFSKSLLTLTALEKSIGKKAFGEVVGDLIERPPGKLKLVPQDDKRPARKNTAQADFA